jgi:tRNA (guanine9-N1)-methyltransferase
MEAEERPSKKRRLTNEDDSHSPEANDLATTKATQNDKLPNEDRGIENARNVNGVVNGYGDRAHEQNWVDSLPPGKPGENDLPPPEETAPFVDSVNGNQTGPSMSKNQQKKLQKKLDWESKRDERKVVRKQKLVAKRERKRAAKAQAIDNGDPETQPTSQPKTWQKSVLLPITVLIDCDFDDLMRDPERKSLAAQITRSYSDNRKAPFRSHLAICSFGGQLRERFDNILTHYKSWRGVRFLDCDFVEAAQQAKTWMIESQQDGKMTGVFSKLNPQPENSVDHAKLQDQAEVVYLTSESDNTLTELKPYSTYIIGGLVDKNREKGICYKRATKRGIKTAKLPIGEFMDMQSRKVLATNHVNEIMVRWLECGDWGEAFVKVIPKRKGGKLKQAVENDDSIEDLEQEDHGEDDPDLERANDENITEDAGDNHEESPSSTQGCGDSDASRKD